MKLKPEEAEFFNTLFIKFLFFCNRSLKVFNNPGGEENIFQITLDKQTKLRQKIYEKMDFFINSFLQEGNLNEEEKKLVETWKFYNYGRFIIYKHLPDYTLLIKAEDAKVFGIVGLIDDLEDKVPDYVLPLMIETMLLPFKDKIIYAGLFNSFNIHFGSGIRKDLENTYKQAKASNEIITFLPYENTLNEAEKDAEELKFYMSTKKNRDLFFHEICRLKNKSEPLKILFSQELGKHYAKGAKKDLKQLGIKKGHFAVIETVIVASGENEKALNKALETVVPKELHNMVYRFKN